MASIAHYYSESVLHVKWLHTGTESIDRFDLCRNSYITEFFVTDITV